MNLLESVVGRLEALDVRCALIGAAAMAVHGASRATLDIDLLTVDRRALEPATWRGLRSAGVDVEIRRGDADDPLAGVVRFRADGQRSIDLIIGKTEWQQEVIARALGGSYGSVEVPVAAAEDLVLLKLYAGGPQDAWDVSQLLVGEERETLIAAVEARVGSLEAGAQELWRRLVVEARSR